MKASGETFTATGRELDVMLAFMGKDADQALMVVKIKGKRLLAGATSKRMAVEHIGEAEEGTTEGDWPITKELVEQARGLCVDGSENVPARAARFQLGRTGVELFDIIDPATNTEHGHYRTEATKLEPSKQLTFGLVSKSIQENKDEGSWFALNDADVRKATRVLAAACNKCPVTFCPPADNEGGCVLKTTGEGGSFRAILLSVPTHGPGKAAKLAEGEGTDSSDEDKQGDGEQPTEDPKNPAPLALAPTPRAKKADKPKSKTSKSKKK